MKKLLLFTLSILGCICVWGQTENGDVEGEGLLGDIMEKGKDFENKTFEPKAYGVDVLEGMYAGWLFTNGDPSSMKVNTFHSSDVGCLQIIEAYYNFDPIKVSFGLGWSNKRIKTKSQEVFYGSQSDEPEVFYGFPSDELLQITANDFVKSKGILDLRSFSLNPLVSWHKTLSHDESLTISFGPILNYNYHVAPIHKYKIDDKRQKDKFEGINHNDFTIDWFLAVEWGGIGLFVKYAPQSVLRSSQLTPEITTLSFGLYL